MLHDGSYGDYRYINSVTINELFECFNYQETEEGSSATKKIRGCDESDEFIPIKEGCDQNEG